MEAKEAKEAKRLKRLKRLKRHWLAGPMQAYRLLSPGMAALTASGLFTTLRTIGRMVRWNLEVLRGWQPLDPGFLLGVRDLAYGGTASDESLWPSWPPSVTDFGADAAFFPHLKRPRRDAELRDEGSAEESSVPGGRRGPTPSGGRGGSGPGPLGELTTGRALRARLTDYADPLADGATVGTGRPAQREQSAGSAEQGPGESPRALPALGAGGSRERPRPQTLFESPHRRPEVKLDRSTSDRLAPAIEGQRARREILSEGRARPALSSSFERPSREAGPPEPSSSESWMERRISAGRLEEAIWAEVASAWRGAGGTLEPVPTGSFPPMHGARGIGVREGDALESGGDPAPPERLVVRVKRLPLALVPTRPASAAPKVAASVVGAEARTSEVAPALVGDERVTVPEGDGGPPQDDRRSPGVAADVARQFEAVLALAGPALSLSNGPALSVPSAVEGSLSNGPAPLSTELAGQRRWSPSEAAKDARASSASEEVTARRVRRRIDATLACLGPTVGPWTQPGISRPTPRRREVSWGSASRRTSSSPGELDTVLAQLMEWVDALQEHEREASEPSGQEAPHVSSLAESADHRALSRELGDLLAEEARRYGIRI